MGHTTHSVHGYTRRTACAMASVEDTTPRVAPVAVKPSDDKGAKPPQDGLPREEKVIDYRALVKQLRRLKKSDVKSEDLEQRIPLTDLLAIVTDIWDGIDPFED